MDSKKIIKLFISSGVWRAVGSLSVLLVSLFIAQALGANGSGIYFLCFAIVSFISNISRLGLDNVIIKLVAINFKADKPNELFSVLVNGIMICLLIASSLSLVLYFYADFLAARVFQNKELASAVRQMLPFMVFSSLCVIVAMTLQGLNKTKSAIFLTNVITNTLFLLFLLNSENSNLESVIFFANVSVVFNFLIGILLLRHVLFQKRYIRGEIKKLLQLSIPFFIIVICAQCTLWMGQIILGIYGTEADVANFAVAQRISMLIAFFLMSINMVVAPKYATLYAIGDIKAIRKLAIVSSRVNFLLTLPLFIVIILFSNEITMYFGTDFNKVAKVLVILSFGQFINALTGSVGYLLSMTGHERTLRNNSILSSCIMVSLCLVLTPQFGVGGAAVSTTSGVIINNFLNLFYVKKYLDINPLNIL